VRRAYQIVSREDSAALRQSLAKEGAALLPMVALIEQGQLAVEELVGQVGKAALEAVLAISAEQVAGPPHPARRSDPAPRCSGRSGGAGRPAGAGEQAAAAAQGERGGGGAGLCGDARRRGPARAAAVHCDAGGEHAALPGGSPQVGRTVQGIALGAEPAAAAGECGGAPEAVRAALR
jgi:hypothetical protein